MSFWYSNTPPDAQNYFLRVATHYDTLRIEYNLYLDAAAREKFSATPPDKSLENEQILRAFRAIGAVLDSSTETQTGHKTPAIQYLDPDTLAVIATFNYVDGMISDLADGTPGIQEFDKYGTIIKIEHYYRDKLDDPTPDKPAKQEFCPIMGTLYGLLTHAASYKDGSLIRDITDSKELRKLDRKAGRIYSLERLKKIILGH